MPPPHFLKIHFNIILPSSLDIPSGLRLSGFPTKTRSTPLLSPIRATRPTQLSLQVPLCVVFTTLLLRHPSYPKYRRYRTVLSSCAELLTHPHLPPKNKASVLMTQSYENSQWPSSLRRGSAAHLLGLRVRIPPRAWMFVVSVVCQVEVSATG